jgi:glucose-1-phosphate adenylyltransferase
MTSPVGTAVVGLILAGGEGKRLFPLTRDRAKPAVPFGGRYRIIDVVLSNFVNSGIYKLSVITQYKAGSLMQHLARGWQLGPQIGHYVAPVPPAMNLGPRFFEGSADAVLQNLDVIENERPAHVCVFGADHIYKMDVRQMLRFHVEREADATVAVIPVPVAEASGFGIVECDAEHRVTGFLEKPSLPPDGRETRLASMGLYIFRAGVLLRAITADADLPDSTHDFGRDILPGLVDTGRLLAYDFTSNDIPGMSEHERGYWRDIGTIDAYWDASQDLVSVSPHFSLYNPQWPIYSAYYP